MIEKELGYERVVEYNDWTTFVKEDRYFARHRTGFTTHQYNDAKKLKREMDDDQKIIEAAQLIGFKPPALLVDYYVPDQWIGKTPTQLHKAAVQVALSMEIGINYGWNANCFAIQGRKGIRTVRVYMDENGVLLYDDRTGTALSIIGRGRTGVTVEEISHLKKMIGLIEDGYSLCTVCGKWLPIECHDFKRYGYAGYACESCQQKVIAPVVQKVIQ